MALVRSELLGQFVNTTTADYKYSRQNWDYLWQQVPRQITRKQKTFSGFLIAFLKSTLSLEYSQEKGQSRSLSITENINCKTSSYLNVRKAIFHATPRQITC